MCCRRWLRRIGWAGRRRHAHPDGKHTRENRCRAKRPRHAKPRRWNACVSFHSRAFESMQIVTGPSLTSVTCIAAPNSPVAIGRPSSAASLDTNA